MHTDEMFSLAQGPVTGALALALQRFKLSLQHRLKSLTAEALLHDKLQKIKLLSLNTSRRDC